MKELLTVFAFACASLTFSAESAAKPNIILMIADDLGPGDYGRAGNKDARTPHLNTLADKGARFRNCYAASPAGSASRAALLTGRRPVHTGVYDSLSRSSVMQLPKEEVTLAEHLKKRGYRTGHFGKWHLSDFEDGQPTPRDHGFDYWMSSFSVAYPSHQNPVNLVRNGKPMAKTSGYSCDIVASESIGWMKAASTESAPFFACISFHEVNGPMSAPPELLKQFAFLNNPEKAQYYATVANLDTAVGKITRALLDLSISENTIIIFTSDNGPAGPVDAVKNIHAYGETEGLRGYKGSLYEGGLRVPAIITAPGRVTPGREIHQAISVLDFYPTLCETLGISVPLGRTLDGVSLMPFFENRLPVRKQPLYWMYHNAPSGPAVAIRERNMKLMAYLNAPGFAPGTGLAPGDVTIMQHAELYRFELYNLAADPGESENLYAKDPIRAQHMKTLLERTRGKYTKSARTWPDRKGLSLKDRPEELQRWIHAQPEADAEKSP